MAIPLGSTEKALTSIARWLLVSVIVAGMLNWWLPGYGIWGAFMVGILAVWTLWLCKGIVIGDSRLMWHPAYFALLGPASILVYHVLASGPGNGQQGPYGLADALNMSLVTHIWLLATGTLVCQELLANGPQFQLVAGICGAAMMAGPLMAMKFGQATAPTASLAMAAFSGVAVWMAPMWCSNGPKADRTDSIYSGPIRIFVLGVAAIVLALLSLLAPLQAVVSIAVAGAVLILAGLSARRRLAIALGTVCAVLAGTAIAFWPDWPGVPMGMSCPLGGGEQALADLPADQTGLAVLLSATGWLGLGWAVAVTTLALGILLTREPSRTGLWGRVVWTIASALSGWALLGKGGLSVPFLTLSACFVWGLLPGVVGWNPRRVSGIFIAWSLVALTLLLGLSRLSGLIAWITSAYGGDDGNMHVFAGFFCALVLCWLTGARKLIWGLVAALFAALAGGGGELLQGGFSDRTASWSDWVAHLKGSAAGTALYIICMLAKWCESREVAKDPERSSGQV